MSAVAATLRSASAATRFGTLTFRESPGEGPPLVLLHGVGGNAGVWERQHAAFAPRRQVAWDAPGYGGSSGLPGAAPALEDYADACIALLDALQIPRVVLLGHSFGGLIAACVASRHPQRVARLLLTACSSGHGSYEPARREALLRARLEAMADGDVAAYARSRAATLLAPGAAPELVEAAAGLIGQLRREGFYQANRTISAADIFGYLPRISAPTRVICGTADAVTPPELNARIAAGIPDADLVRIENAGHLLFLDSAAQFNAAVIEFLQRDA